MRIAFYMPFKPLDHPHPSGDLVIGSGIYQYLRQRGHDIHPVSRIRLRWFYWKPWQWLRLGTEMVRVRRLLRQLRPALWLTYHSYYKAPDVLGAVCAPGQGIPYAVFQGVYATKYRREAKTRPGFHLNRYALLQADAVFTNKRRDEINLRRLLPENRLHYIPPGIRLERFPSEVGPSIALPRVWGADHLPVVLTAAMFRPGVKTDGLARVIICCGRLAAQGLRFRLVVCGNGEGASYLKQLAQGHLGKNVHFAGRVPQDQMRHYYRSADLFAFPGIREGLGMVFLEAQAAGLPVVACNGWGASEIVQHEQTGLLSPPGEWEKFERNIMRLLTDRSLSKKMGTCARQHIACHHDLERNYSLLETHLLEVAARQADALGDRQRA